MSNNSQIKNITEKEQLIFMKNLRYLLAINFLTGLALSKKKLAYQLIQYAHI